MKPDEPCGGPINSDRLAERVDPFAQQALANRTRFAPETIASKHNEGERFRMKTQENRQT
jgi:hypothetical protein